MSANYPDISRAEIMREDYRDGLARCGDGFIHYMLSKGWPLDELKSCGLVAIERAATEHARRLAAMDAAQIGAAVVVFFVAGAFVALGLAADLTVSGV